MTTAPYPLDPSIDDLLADESLVNGDLGAAELELVRRLRNRLPAFVVAKNAAKGWTTAVTKIPDVDPDHINIAPLDLTQVELSGVYVAAAVETQSQGVGAFKNIVRVRIWSLSPNRLVISQQVVNHQRRAEAIRAVLLPYLRGCIDPQGQEAWSVLQPTGYSIIPASNQFSGVAATYDLIQAPTGGYIP